jgi:hypothetical protein
MDGETNFLAQLYGDMMACIDAGHHIDILSQQNYEPYWTGKLPKIDYPKALPRGHWQDKLWPGNGVFNPACFQH